MSDSQQTLDAITLSIMARALAGIAEEMGAVLIHGAYSSNIKERRDCSAALTDANGRMICQAEHIPVHLGAMQDSVLAVIDKNPVPGDVFMLNAPFAGGNHLPAVRLGDLRAQIAANRRASTRPAELAGQRGHDMLRAAFTNVETSQRLTETVPLALGQARPSQATEVSAQGQDQGQGTMNNLIIGGADWSQYETRGGGQGASRAAPGASCRHVGMTTTLNTPTEPFLRAGIPDAHRALRAGLRHRRQRKTPRRRRHARAKPVER